MKPKEETLRRTYNIIEGFTYKVGLITFWKDSHRNGGLITFWKDSQRKGGLITFWKDSHRKGGLTIKIKTLYLSFPFFGQRAAKRAVF